MSWSNCSSWSGSSGRRGRWGTLKPAITILGLGLFLAGCGADAPAASDGEGSDDAQNGDAQARFPANQQVGPLHAHVPEEWEPFDVESSDDGEITGFSETGDGTAERYVILRDDFQGASRVAGANAVLSADIQFRGGEQEEPQQIEIPGADVAWSADVTWPGDRGEVTARYWIAEVEESGALAAVEYGGYGVDEDELDAYEEALEVTP